MQSDILSLFQQLVEAQKVKFTLLQPPYDEIDSFDLGLRKMIYDSYCYTHIQEFLHALEQGPILYHYTDIYECNYSFLRLGNWNTNPTYIIIGPYLAETITSHRLHLIHDKLKLPHYLDKEMIEYYNVVPVFQEINRFYSMLSLMASQVLASPDDFSVKFLTPYNEMANDLLQYFAEPTPVISSKMIEDRYKAENEFLLYVAQGNDVKAQFAFHNFLQYQITPRFKDPVRNIKNLTIVLNTLCRKTVENCNVHPIHIDDTSRDFAIRVEKINSTKDGLKLQKTIIRKYCLLVTNHSLTGYSPLIQRVINHIDMNLSEALSLRQLSELFSINSSYLSSTFGKEMGITITNYINQQKVRFAITLLNKTDDQIQDIASQVGIHDVNYFIKVFKKIVGMTPKEYRESIKGRRDL